MKQDNENQQDTKKHLLNKLSVGEVIGCPSFGIKILINKINTKC